MKKFRMDPYQMGTPSSYPSFQTKQLFEAILSLKTMDEVADFFRDLLTMAELKEFTNRWQMVLMLSEGKPYLEVAQKLGVSTTTVARVAYWLHNGRGGYERVVGKILAKVRKGKGNDYPQNDLDRALLAFSKLRK